MHETKDMSEKVKRVMETKPAKNDPNGSYTGVPIDKGETPVQDADDL